VTTLGRVHTALQWCKNANSYSDARGKERAGIIQSIRRSVGDNARFIKQDLYSTEDGRAPWVHVQDELEISKIINKALAHAATKEKQRSVAGT